MLVNDDCIFFNSIDWNNTMLGSAVLVYMAKKSKPSLWLLIKNIFDCAWR